MKNHIGWIIICICIVLGGCSSKNIHRTDDDELDDSYDDVEEIDTNTSDDMYGECELDEGDGEAEPELTEEEMQALAEELEREQEELERKNAQWIADRAYINNVHTDCPRQENIIALTLNIRFTVNQMAQRNIVAHMHIEPRDGSSSISEADYSQRFYCSTDRCELKATFGVYYEAFGESRGYYSNKNYKAIWTFTDEYGNPIRLDGIAEQDFWVR